MSDSRTCVDPAHSEHCGEWWPCATAKARLRAQQRQVTLTLTAFDVDVLLDALDVADIEGQIDTDDYQRLTRLLREVGR